MKKTCMLLMLLFVSAGMTWAQQSLLTQEQKDEINRRAMTNSENDSVYLASVVKRVLDVYHVGSDYKPEDFMSLVRRVFPSNEAENKAKSLSKFAKKIIIKGKLADEKDKEIWRPCYTYYLSSIYLKEAEQIALERKKQEEYEKDSIKRNNWHESDLWNALQEVCALDLSLKDSAKYYAEFIISNGLDIEELWTTDFLDNEECRSIYYKYFSFENWTGVKVSILRDILRNTLYLNYLQILDETGYRRRDWGYNGKYSQKAIQDSIECYPLFLKDIESVSRLKTLRDKFITIDTTHQWQLWMMCNSPKFRERVDTWVRNTKMDYPATGVIRDTISTWRDSREYTVINIPYILVDGNLVANGICTLKKHLAQRSDANGELFEGFTFDITMTVSVENGKAKSKSTKGQISQWEENKAAGKGKKSYFEQQKAIRAAKPIVKKKVDITKEEDIYNNFPGICSYGPLCVDDINNTLKYAGNVPDRWEPQDRKSILKEYLKHGHEKYLKKAKRPFNPIEFSDL